MSFLMAAEREENRLLIDLTRLLSGGEQRRQCREAGHDQNDPHPNPSSGFLDIQGELM